VAARLGFAARAGVIWKDAPLPDYRLPFGGPVVVSLLGAALVLAALALAARGLRPGREGAAVIDARVRLFCALALIVAAAALPWTAVGRLGALFGLAVVFAALGAARLGWLLTRAALLLPFVGLMVVSLLATRLKSPFGMTFYAVILAKAGVSLLALGGFLAATREAEAIAALRAWRVPATLVQMLVFQLRYLRVLRAETERLLRARAARAGQSGPWRRRIAGAGGLVAALFVRAYERSERLRLAMSARGFNGRLPEAARPPLRWGDWLFSGVWLVLVVWISVGAL